jgi:hypothetical protein
MAKRGSLTRELTLAAKVSRRRKSESEQAYFNRIMLEVGGLSDDVRETITRGSGLVRLRMVDDAWRAPRKLGQFEVESVD